MLEGVFIEDEYVRERCENEIYQKAENPVFIGI